MAQSRLRVRDREQISELASWLTDLYQSARTSLSFGFVDERADIVGQLGMAKPRFVRSYLYRDREEALVVSF